MTLTAAGHADAGIVEALYPVSRNPAQEKRVVVILSAQPTVLVQRLRQMHLVARAAKFRGPVQGFHEGAFVEGGFAFDQHTVDPGQKRDLGERERIVLRRGDDVVGIATRAAQVLDGMAGNTGNARIRGRVVLVVEVRIVERAAEQSTWESSASNWATVQSPPRQGILTTLPRRP